MNEVITGGVLDVPGKTMFEKMHWLETNGDDLRKFLLFEPRGKVAQPFTEIRKRERSAGLVQTTDPVMNPSHAVHDPQRLPPSYVIQCAIRNLPIGVGERFGGADAMCHCQIHRAIGDVRGGGS